MAKKRTRQQKIQAKTVQRTVPHKVAVSETVIGYDFNLIKRDLVKTIIISGILISGLIGLSFYLR